MATVLASQAKFATSCRVAKSCRRAVPAVVVRAQASQKASPVQKAVAAAASLPALIVASPAFALVDDRLNGDGTGLVLGVNDAALGWIIGGVFLTIWTIWFNAQKDFGKFDDEDSGLSL